METEPDRTVRDESMLRALLVSTLDREDALQVLAREEAALTAELTPLRAYLAELAEVEQSTDPKAMGLDLRARMLEAMLGWISEARHRFQATHLP